jgi:hypothetical protein
MSGLATFLVGALVCYGHFWIATTLAVASLLLLDLKAVLEKLATSVAPHEILTFAKFLLLSGVILPALPNPGVRPVPHQSIQDLAGGGGHQRHLLCQLCFAEADQGAGRGRAGGVAGRRLFLHGDHGGDGEEGRARKASAPVRGRNSHCVRRDVCAAGDSAGAVQPAIDGSALGAFSCVGSAGGRRRLALVAPGG